MLRVLPASLSRGELDTYPISSRFRHRASFCSPREWFSRMVRQRARSQDLVPAIRAPFVVIFLVDTRLESPRLTGWPLPREEARKICGLTQNSPRNGFLVLPLFAQSTVRLLRREVMFICTTMYILHGCRSVWKS